MPGALLPGERAQRPAIIPNLRAAAPSASSHFIRSIHASRRPTFWMKHALLPHGPWIYLPRAADAARGPGPAARDADVPGFYDDYLTHHNEQRYLLQLGFVDRLLGRADRAAEEPGHVRRHADRGHGRPRLRVAGGRADTRRSVSRSNVTSSARCRCS